MVIGNLLACANERYKYAFFYWSDIPAGMIHILFNFHMQTINKKVEQILFIFLSIQQRNTKLVTLTIYYSNNFTKENKIKIRYRGPKIILKSTCHT